MPLSTRFRNFVEVVIIVSASRYKTQQNFRAQIRRQQHHPEY